MEVDEGVPNEILTTAIETLVSGGDLEEPDAAAVLREVMSGNASEVQTAAFLTSLRAKGETVGEITGLARTMREFSARVPLEDHGLVDTCGTGGDKSGTFNVSTAAAFVVAGAGARVAKHGNRSATSLCGSADVLEALGAVIELPPERVGECIREAGIGFMFAPVHHQAMKHVIPVRMELGIRTTFNFLGPLTNPAGALYQLVGVSDPGLLEVMAISLKLLGCRHGIVAHGSDGLDEITVCGPSAIAEIRDGIDGVNVYEVVPEDYGISRLEDPAALKGGDARENAGIIRSVLRGETGGRRDIVLLNAGAALYVAGVAESMAAGVELAAGSIDSGAASDRLSQFIEFTKRGN
ncbi:MAG: anthranilate phosphoribosyltransferase [Gaiellales bacterium]|nr:MAG: anthranilate phosphoribosyltransferase [Gaiellales bacterium]